MTYSMLQGILPESTASEIEGRATWTDAEYGLACSLRKLYENNLLHPQTAPSDRIR
eukprot:CAMPEP_0169080820 /NCGR_PEP_ID=MMETSP1015-20121227/10682_1 /TAXON_ID=342587 /ORGANISM="Karlodinium micrum, Strain CCMP2283" /LENGTH=55 /DNA_ID=CAMNT_0009140569 /DNA_START=1944 /DNA_END=2108 /DNA_ORIENTATION=-